jgi:hypothetical protein
MSRSDAPPELTLAEYLSRLPPDEAQVREKVERVRALTADERVSLLSDLVRSLLRLAGDRPPIRDEQWAPFAPRWRDPTLGARTD